tara:strand:+ start:485 stop:778 length:294 start_codon:yes stop_codon:yes gene_type:complete
LKNIHQIIFLFFLISCSNANYSIEKKPICYSYKQKNKLSVYCNEFKEKYSIKYDNFDKTVMDCEKINFYIKSNDKIVKETFLKCNLKNDKKNFIYLK